MTLKKISNPYKNFVFQIFIFIKTLKKYSLGWRQMQLNLIEYDYSITKKGLFILTQIHHSILDSKKNTKR
ncbi:hypothetical protein SAMD00079811_12760 [Scytonema sp. HK-05]|nr:hypothetical protein NIES2130_04370 [Scytonema sp. HK-05]BAY43695.1 hypothetical protein SAMD00079811_12760 [Scytonema sp. HK-05]